MTSPIQSYLERVMRRSGLTKREKAEWIEEMSSHLSDEIEHLMAVGHADEEATKIALEKFGQPTLIRRKIAKETFGLSIPMIYGLFSLFFVWFSIDLYIVHLQFPGGWFKRYPDTWAYLSSIVSAIPNSPSLMLALCVSLLMLFKTRCLKDRVSILSTLGIWGVMWVLIRLPQSFNMNELLFSFRDLTIVEPSLSIISGTLIIWGLLLYLWVRNPWVSVTPILVSLTTGLWQPIFWGIWSNTMLVPLIIRGLLIILLFLMFRAIDKHLRYRQSVSTS